jgi:hypothetical protein
MQVVRMEGGWNWPLNFSIMDFGTSGAKPSGYTLRELVNNDIRCDNGRWIELAQVRVYSWALISVVFNFLLHITES